MESSLEYMARKHEELGDGYRTPDGKHQESCGQLAIDVAERLINEGELPRLVTLRGKKHDFTYWGEVMRKTLAPKRYTGVVWGCHVVCCLDNYVYDPMIGKPVSLEDYPQLAFGVDVDMEVFVSEVRIKDFVQD